MKSTWSQLNSEIENCQKCSRLVAHCQKVATLKRKSYSDFDYWGKPVANFGKAPAQLLIIGLAPGAHGANRTGRMFTGDRSGDWLFGALYRAGFSNRADSRHTNDGLRLRNCVITNICHCAPPDNKPMRGELESCRPFLDETIRLVRPTIFLALGGLAWQAIVKIAIESNWLDDPKPRPKFGHAAKVELRPVCENAKTPHSEPESRRWLVGSYHPSQQNTFTGRLTEEMFDQVFKEINRLIRIESKS